MAHEFKTPLTSVMAATTSLLYRITCREQDGIAQIADEEANHLKNLIDERWRWDDYTRHPGPPLSDVGRSFARLSPQCVMRSTAAPST
jgi:signal transduction histidine kinase